MILFLNFKPLFVQRTPNLVTMQQKEMWSCQNNLSILERIKMNLCTFSLWTELTIMSRVSTRLIDFRTRFVSFGGAKGKWLNSDYYCNFLKFLKLDPVYWWKCSSSFKITHLVISPKAAYSSSFYFWLACTSKKYLL